MPPDASVLLTQPSESSAIRLPTGADPLARGVVMERFAVSVEGLQAVFVDAGTVITPPVLQVPSSAAVELVLIQPLNVAEKCVSAVHTKVWKCS